MGLLFEIAIVAIILVTAIWLLSPVETDPSIALGMAISELTNFLLDSFWGPKIVLTALFGAFAVVAPFYVCCGFALYLNRRVELEGWDLDLEFQRMVKRITPLLGTVLIAVCCMPTDAQESRTTDQTKDSIATEINEIVVSERISRTESRLRQDEPREVNPTSNDALAIFLQILMWTLLGVGVLWLVVKIVTSDYIRTAFARKRENEVPIQQNISSLNRRLALPNDVVTEATTAWREGHSRSAVSLLYRGALYVLITTHKCDINPSDTEASCMEAVRQSIPTLSSSFNTIASSWQQMAYARFPLSDGDFNALRLTYVEKFAHNA
jgi:hypothetical protein